LLWKSFPKHEKYFFPTRCKQRLQSFLSPKGLEICLLWKHLPNTEKIVSKEIHVADIAVIFFCHQSLQSNTNIYLWFFQPPAWSLVRISEFGYTYMQADPTSLLIQVRTVYPNLYNKYNGLCLSVYLKPSYLPTNLPLPSMYLPKHIPFPLTNLLHPSQPPWQKELKRVDRYPFLACPFNVLTTVTWVNENQRVWIQHHSDA
jgi:hypothetical protein